MVFSIDEGARSAQEDDISVITELACQAIAEKVQQRGGEVWSLKEARCPSIEMGLRRDLADNCISVVVGTIDEEIVGYGVASLIKLHDDSTLGRISDLYVMPEARGVGVGEAIIRLLIDWACKHDCTGVDSIALPGDRHTKNFFETHGLVARSITVHRKL
ncbi:MAG: GNAT family N-acetyltransferase [Acidimicrobiaceae bacterium]|nr:GNAT family N-acetyltransferase [Acidimicrobiaceae bacterium]